ncbi:MAG: hypothetical protein M3Y76_00120, partial [Chloroflexota bacterium]|nr:hypothetical protein [Chloroflexota bacterium]
MRRPRPQGAIWLVIHIGYRRNDIVQLLRKVALQYRGETGDMALNALAWLGIEPDARQWVLTNLHARASRHWNHHLESALAHLADPRSVDVVRTSWLPPRRGLRIAAEYKGLMPALSLRVITEIADRHPHNAELQRRIWGLLVDLLNRRPDLYETDVMFGSDYAPNCNTSDVIPGLFHWLNPGSYDPQATENTRRVFYERLKECVRPDQLAGWQSPSLDTALPVLHRDACLDTIHITLGMTAEAYLKRAAWNVALCTGRSNVLSASWFRDGVANESSPFERAEVLELLACFKHKHLPNEVISWITEPFDPEKQDDTVRGDAELFAREASIEIARSAATAEAFSALLNFGLTFDGQVLINSARALVEVAIVLLNSDQTSIIPDLVRVATQGPEPRQRTAAISALDILADRNLVPAEYASGLERLIFDSQLHDYEQSRVVGLLGYFSNVALSLEALAAMRRWAADPEDERSISSLKTLAYKGYLLEDLELLQSRLSISFVKGNFVHSRENRGEGASELIGLLYHISPDRFEGVLVSLLDSLGHLDWSDSAQLVRAVRFHYNQNSKPLPPDLQSALIRLAIRLQGKWTAETAIFRNIAAVAPDALADAQWEESWATWLPTSRTALAEALGSASYRRRVSLGRATVLLRKLCSDGQYAVRRAAYRSLAQKDTTLFISTLSSWSRSPQMDVRNRSAEALLWIQRQKEFEDS